MRKKAIVFDNDNTIADTEPLHLEARQAVCSRRGAPLTREQYIEHWMGKTPSVGVSWSFPHAEQSERDLIVREVGEEYQQLREQGLSLIPGFLPLLHVLNRRGYVFAIASTLSQASIRRGLELVLPPEDRALFLRHIVSGEDVANHKPAPDVWLLAAKLLGITPKECIAFEDSVTGVTSAKAAGMFCIARASIWTNADELLKAGADLVCTDYEAIAAMFELNEGP